ncbi:MAG: glycosyltransferase [Rhizobiales bacterium]|nr:glycosyltransferase [Hyphomicrobiales bacterium]
MPALSIIVPVLNEEAGIVAALEALADYRRFGHEVIVVDGGSNDRTAELARPLADLVIDASRGRAAQMNAGAARAADDILVFLHVDTRLPPASDCLIIDGLRRSGCLWGRFDVDIAGRNPMLRIVAATMNLRSRLSGIATGDQAIFVTREAFAECGGYPDIPLMEDIALSRRLKRLSRPLCLRPRVTTSGRRWEQRGALRTILLMWRLRLAYFLGAEPNALARRYGYVPRED